MLSGPALWDGPGEGAVTLLVPLALIGWLPLSLLLFATLPPRRAALLLVVAGTLFLPVGGYDLPGLPDYTKESAIAYGLLMGILAFDSRRRKHCWDEFRVPTPVVHEGEP